MPIPRTVARLNRVGLNRLARRAAPRVPGFGVVLHRGRRSGRTYATPVNVFPTDGGYAIALTYGTGSDWVANVLAAGRCTLRTRGREVELVDPRLMHDPSRRHVGPVVRRALRLLDVADFLVLSTGEPGRGGPAREGPGATG